MGRQLAGGVSVMFMCGWESLASTIHVEVSLPRTTYLSIVALFHGNCIPVFSRSLCPATKQKWASIHGGYSPQFTGLKGSVANMLASDTSAHLQGSVHASLGQVCVAEGGPNIRHMVMMLCLMTAT